MEKISLKLNLVRRIRIYCIFFNSSFPLTKVFSVWIFSTLSVILIRACEILETFQTLCLWWCENFTKDSDGNRRCIFWLKNKLFEHDDKIGSAVNTDIVFQVYCDQVSPLKPINTTQLLEKIMENGLLDAIPGEVVIKLFDPLTDGLVSSSLKKLSGKKSKLSILTQLNTILLSGPNLAK